MRILFYAVLLCALPFVVLAKPKKLPESLQDRIQKQSALPNPEEEKKEIEDDPFKDLPQSGVLASYGSGVGSQMVGGFGELGLNESTQNPITASVARQNNRWQVKVANSSKKRVSVNLQLKQFSKEGTKVKSNSMSFTLGPNSSSIQFVNEGIGVTGVLVEMSSWRVR
jgi:hypothetical protein